MGSGIVHKCDQCGYSVSTSGPWEFYRDAKGRRKVYGHPVPCSAEAAKSGIHGLSGIVYCPKCDETYDIILVEFKKPTSNTLSLWSGTCEPKGGFKKQKTMKCPKCGGLNLVLDPVKDPMAIICPRCKKGKLIGDPIWDT